MDMLCYFAPKIAKFVRWREDGIVSDFSLLWFLFPARKSKTKASERFFANVVDELSVSWKKFIRYTYVSCRKYVYANLLARMYVHVITANTKTSPKKKKKKKISWHACMCMCDSNKKTLPQIFIHLLARIFVGV